MDIEWIGVITWIGICERIVGGWVNINSSIFIFWYNNVWKFVITWSIYSNSPSINICCYVAYIIVKTIYKPQSLSRVIITSVVCNICIISPLNGYSILIIITYVVICYNRITGPWIDSSIRPRASIAIKLTCLGVEGSNKD